MTRSLDANFELTACSIEPLRVLIGAALDVSVGILYELPRRPSALKALLEQRRTPETPDSWLILGSFAGGKRTKSNWNHSGGVALDLDWEDPTVPRNEGAHQPIPLDEAAAITRALGLYPIPSVAYLTPRGLRVIHLLAADVSDEADYSALVERAGDRLLQHLKEHGVALWRDGRAGLRFDAASLKPVQPMRLPQMGAEVMLLGGDDVISETLFEDELVERLGLQEALPACVATACSQIATWVQIAPEAAATGVMALASGLIGNACRVSARGLMQPLSLQYVTSLPSGSGKGTVRSELRKLVKQVESEVLGRREQAKREHEAFESRLQEWKTAGNSIKKVETRGQRPQPPKLDSLGGERTSFFVSEANIEGVVATLEDSPRGFLWSSDEAHEVIGMLGMYSDGGSARSVDAARLRRMIDGSPLEIHRARSNVSPVRRVEMPFVAIDVDVQPKVLEGLFTDEDRVSGTTARMLIHAPPPMQGRRQYADPQPPPEQADLKSLENVLLQLWRLPLTIKDGVTKPSILLLDEEAEAIWARELDLLEKCYEDAGDEEFGKLGHARGQILRLAGVLCLLRDPQAEAVTAVDVRRAIVHMRYHLAHHRRVLASAQRQAEGARLESLKPQVMKLFESQRDTGVRPKDLRRLVSKQRYGGQRGLEKAYADLHGIGWVLQRREVAAGAKGRRPVPAFFPLCKQPIYALNAQNPSQQSHQSSRPSRGKGFMGYVREDRGNGEDAGELLSRASERLLLEGRVVLPAPGVRVRCPACGSSDGLGVFPDDSSRWHCHSDKHGGARGGCAVDFLLATENKQMPTPAEAVSEAKRILGVDMPGSSPSARRELGAAVGEASRPSAEADSGGDAG